MKQTYKDFWELFFQEFPEATCFQDAVTEVLEITVGDAAVLVADPEAHIALAGEGADGWVISAVDHYGEPMSGLYKQTITTDILDAADIAGEMYAMLLLGVVQVMFEI
jgi:hypothetical protein